MESKNYLYRVASIGGVGSSAMVQYVEHEKGPMIDDEKHFIAPGFKMEEPFDKPYKFLYIIGNPYNAVMSIWRRGFKTLHEEAIASAFREENQHIVDEKDTLLQYLRKGKDAYRMKEHIINWYHYHPLGEEQVMIVKYEKIPYLIEQIRLFLGMEMRFQWKERESDYRNHYPKVRDELIKVYKPVKILVDSLPDMCWRKK